MEATITQPLSRCIRLELCCFNFSEEITALEQTLSKVSFNSLFRIAEHLQESSENGHG